MKSKSPCLDKAMASMKRDGLLPAWRGRVVGAFAMVDSGRGLRRKRVWFPADGSNVILHTWQTSHRIAMAMSRRIVKGGKP